MLFSYLRSRSGLFSAAQLEWSILLLNTAACLPCGLFFPFPSVPLIRCAERPGLWSVFNQLGGSISVVHVGCDTDRNRDENIPVCDGLSGPCSYTFSVRASTSDGKPHMLILKAVLATLLTVQGSAHVVWRGSGSSCAILCLYIRFCAILERIRDHSSQVPPSSHASLCTRELTKDLFGRDSFLSPRLVRLG